jgi:hypothetical protein
MNITKKRKTYIQHAWQPILRIVSLVSLIATIIARSAASVHRATLPPVSRRSRPVRTMTGRWGSTGEMRRTAVEYFAAASRGFADVTATTSALDSQSPYPGYPASIHRSPVSHTVGPHNRYLAPQRTKHYGPSKRSAKPPAMYRLTLIDRGSPRPYPRIYAWLY